MADRKPLVAGNWKMNGSHRMADALLAEIRELAGGRAQPYGGAIDCLVCPPFPYLASAARLLEGSGIALGAQNVASQSAGAFTGEVDAEMLVDCGCTHALVGHSERRALFGETDAVVADKLRRALAAGLVVVVCVGETLAEREAGQTEAVLSRQLAAVMPVIAGSPVERVVIAYEPVWAIGTGKTASPGVAQEAHAFIRAQLVAGGVAAAAGIRLLYGGSVKPENARELFAQPDIDGGLIGGASLKSADFAAICEAAVAVAKVGG
ncbi:MAG: triose-phosphate isomerase [Burkholderiaceae bacterium]